MNALAQIGHDTASTLLDSFTSVPAPIDESRRLQARAACHFGDNDIIGLLIRALAARYPVVRRLAGDESFIATARRFVRAEPSHLSTVLHFGEAFPAYLRSLGHAASFEYLADVAEIEAARARAMRSADARPISRAALASLSSSRMRELGVLLHPSVSLVASRFPIVTIWAANQTDDSNGVILRWRPEAALIARPFLDVDVVPLSASGHAFLRQVAVGAPLAAAMAAAAVCDPVSDPATHLRLLIDTSIVVGVHRCEPSHQIELF
jgi:Putative DNA-binding domain